MCSSDTTVFYIQQWVVGWLNENEPEFVAKNETDVSKVRCIMYGKDLTRAPACKVLSTINPFMLKSAKRKHFIDVMVRTKKLGYAAPSAGGGVKQVRGQQARQQAGQTPGVAPVSLPFY